MGWKMVVEGREGFFRPGPPAVISDSRTQDRIGSDRIKEILFQLGPLGYSLYTPFPPPHRGSGSSSSATANGGAKKLLLPYRGLRGEMVGRIVMGGEGE